MKITKKKSTKYPLEIRLTDGSVMVIPDQRTFDNPWLRKHGCSLMAEYIALQWTGTAIKPWPKNLLKWHKKHTPDQIHAKVTVKGVAEGINDLALPFASAKYYKTTTKSRMEKALKDGKLVIYERKDPIHTVILIPDAGRVYVASNGTVRETTIAKELKRVLTSTKYRGMVEVMK